MYIFYEKKNWLKMNNYFTKPIIHIITKPALSDRSVRHHLYFGFVFKFN